LTQEQLTLSHIWDRMTEAESQVKYWKQRAEKAETIVNDLDNWRREQEDKKWREKHES
jgi:proteasome assembly chaperone (PAC2) family protein